MIKLVGTSTQSTIQNSGVWLFTIAEEQNLPLKIWEFYYNNLRKTTAYVKQKPWEQKHNLPLRIKELCYYSRRKKF